MQDSVAPYLWTNNEVYRYMNDAYRMFVRLTGGIPDSTSAITQVPIVAGQSYSDVSPLILKFRLAELQSDGGKITIINPEEVRKLTRIDYGVAVSIKPSTPGRITHMVIGADRIAAKGQVRWIQQPLVNDVALLTVLRLPKDQITENGSDDFEFSEVNEEHHEHFLSWMKYRAYGKQDAETFDRGRSDNYFAEFQTYCRMAKAENERYASKVRVVSYGGL
ncbi:MAG: hypothetical protein QFB87_05145 [Patescibacteria group bacterium]|nr:hypothetical protein [Patescibacteria group bacterium]